MKCLLLLFIVSIFLLIANILSFATPIRRTAKSTLCLPSACITDPSFCFCSVEENLNDSCCNLNCRLCPANFTIPSIIFDISPLNFFPLNSFNFSEINFSFLGLR
ncbi:unnamed protein product [Rotaria sp. Silwood1]|nr:unnamed protein product [Rotaria sp. Silwood1]CAF3374290.1 unnamed protein product [Rotaria sp. Silwood1]CAF3394114.1 unnamed protein product [Rotaria sp. Silwood1]CAF4561426.1 unnamed protein product [Rotaria sp. Silwood1]